MSHFTCSGVPAKEVDEIVHAFLLDGKKVVPILQKIETGEDLEITPIYTLLVYDPARFDQERTEQIERRSILQSQ